MKSVTKEAPRSPNEHSTPSKTHRAGPVAEEWRGEPSSGWEPWHRLGVLPGTRRRSLDTRV